MITERGFRINLKEIGTTIADKNKPVLFII